MPTYSYIIAILKVAVIYDIVNEINKAKLIEFIVGLQQPDGSKRFKQLELVYI